MIEWFKKSFDEEADSDDVIKKLRDIKDTKEWMRWLFIKYKLNGLCKCWYGNGQIWFKGNYKDGERHGLYEWFNKNDRINGQIVERQNYKNGKIQ